MNLMSIILSEEEIERSMVSDGEFVTFQLVSWVRCGT